MNENVEFKITRIKAMNKYNIDCIYTERPQKDQIRCVSVLKSKGFAEYMLEIIKKHWQNHNKILRFSYKNNIGEIKIINQYEYHHVDALDKYFEQYQKSEMIE